MDNWKSLRVLSIPLKMKCFMWLLLKDRLALRGRLPRLGFVQDEGFVCLLCGVEREESHNLFIHCSRIYSLWGRVAKLWDWNFVGTRNMGSCLDMWCYAVQKGSRELI